MSSAPLLILQNKFAKWKLQNWMCMHILQFLKNGGLVVLICIFAGWQAQKSEHNDNPFWWAHVQEEDLTFSDSLQISLQITPMFQILRGRP